MKADIRIKIIYYLEQITNKRSLKSDKKIVELHNKIIEKDMHYIEVQILKFLDPWLQNMRKKKEKGQSRKKSFEKFLLKFVWRISALGSQSVEFIYFIGKFWYFSWSLACWKWTTPHAIKIDAYMLVLDGTFFYFFYL